MTINHRFAHWCKPGQHSFDPDDPDQKLITVADAEGNAISILTCGLHLTRVFELASPKDENSPQETENDE